MQALDRTAPILPLRPGLPEKATHDYLRHGTTSLFAALEVATGKVTDACYDRHTNVEFLDFLKLVARVYPRVKCGLSRCPTLIGSGLPWRRSSRRAGSRASSKAGIPVRRMTSASAGAHGDRSWSG